MKIAVIEGKEEKPHVAELLKRKTSLYELLFTTSSYDEACLFSVQSYCDLFIIHSDSPELLQFALFLKEHRSNVEIVVFTNNSGFFDHKMKYIVFGALQNSSQLDVCLKDTEKRLKKNIEAGTKQKHEIIMQQKVERYIRLGIISSVIMGKAEDEWVEQFFEQLLAINKEVAIILIININQGAYSLQAASSVCCKIEEQMKFLTVRVLKDSMICLYLGPAIKDRSLKSPLKKIIQNSYPITLKDFEISIFETESSKTFKGLLSAFTKIRDSFPTSHILPSWKPLEIYNLEIQLSRQIENCDWVKTRETLNILGDYVNDLNKNDVVINRSYYSHLWRQMDRNIWKNTGKRITIVEKSLIDLKLSQVWSISSFNEIMFEFLQQLVSAMALGSSGQTHKLVQKSKEYIAVNYADDISLEAVAEYLEISSTYLSKIFKEIEGVNYKEYVIRIRMEHAKLMLADGNFNTSEIARLVGYPNSNYFSQAFKKYSGVSPTDFSGRRKK